MPALPIVHALVTKAQKATFFGFSKSADSEKVNGYLLVHWLTNFRTLLPKRRNRLLYNRFIAGAIHSLVGETYLATLEFDGGQQGERKDFTPLVPLHITW